MPGNESLIGTPRAARTLAHRILLVYNALVVFLLAGFMSVTQQKIIASMNARAFLEDLPAMPLSPELGLALSLCALFVLWAAGHLYRRDTLPRAMHWTCLVIEIVACLACMRSLNLAYDGVVLLVVADLMHRYEGRNQGYLLIGAMLVLYAIADYSLAAFAVHAVPFDAYTAYYVEPVRAVLSALRGGLVSLNLVLFIGYLVVILKGSHAEKQRIAMLNDQLADANLRLRAYAIEAERTAETRERNRLAREIHDTLGHALTGIAAGLDACIVMVDTAPDFTKQQLVKIRETALRGIKDVRRSVKKLRPDDLEKMPLREALEHMTMEFCASTGMDVRLNILKMPAHLREDEEEVVYRVVQEGITNANRHGHAQHQTVTITVEQGRIYLLLYDDGEGAPVDADGRVEEGFGLKHMKERVGLLHGTVRYESGQAFGGHGFSLEVVIPERKAALSEGAKQTKDLQQTEGNDVR